MKNLFRNAIVIFSIAGTTVMVNSCKKMDTNVKPVAAAETLERFKNEIKSKPSVQRLIINEKVRELTVTDAQGREHSINSDAQRGGPCNAGLYHCSLASDISDLEYPEAYLIQATRLNYCGHAGNNTSDVEITYQYSVPYNIVASSGANLSRGRLRFKNAFNTVIYNNLNITPVTITHIGTDPDCNSREVFEVTFELVGLPNDYFTTGYTMESSFFMYTDCSYQPTFSGLFSAPYTFESSSSAGAPCSRTDQVFINSPSGPSDNVYALGIGLGINCTFSGTWTYPSSHDVEYWLTSTPGTVYSKSVGPFNAVMLNQITYGSGSWTIRYRNRITGGGACTGPWYTEVRTM